MFAQPLFVISTARPCALPISSGDNEWNFFAVTMRPAPIRGLITIWRARKRETNAQTLEPRESQPNDYCIRAVAIRNEMQIVCDYYRQLENMAMTCASIRVFQLQLLFPRFSATAGRPSNVYAIEHVAEFIHSLIDMA